MFVDVEGLDAHPLVRGHFGAALRKSDALAFQAAHERLYRHYAAAAPELPESLAEMQPLLHAVGHACAAGLAQEAWTEVYSRRIYRGGAKAYIIKQLGAPAANLTALAQFFEKPWTTLRESLTRESSRAAALSRAGFALRALGRLADAEAATAAALALREQQGDSKNAALEAGNLSELRLALGRITAAIEVGALAVTHADASDEIRQKLYQPTTYADALAQAGRRDEAMALFAEAEKRQAKWEPNLPRHYSQQGYRYWDFLLDCGAANEVRERVAQAMQITQSHGFSLLTQSLDALADARVLALYAVHGDEDARRNAGVRMDEAVEALRLAGDDEILVRGLLIRACFRCRAFGRSGDAPVLRAAIEDLSEAQDIAWRGGMKLHLADWRLESARLCLAQIAGAPAEEVVPLAERVECLAAPARTSAKPFWRQLLGNLLRKIAPARLVAPRFEWRVVSVADQPSTPLVKALTPEEKTFLRDAEEHYRAAAVFIEETGYRRRDRERRDLRARLDALSALG